jgi:hypothetical protein
MVGQRSCKVTAKDPDTHADFCKEWEETTPAGLVQLNTAKAQTTGLGRLENIQGKGALSNFLTGFATIVIANALKSAITNSNTPDVVLRTQTSTATSTIYGNTNNSQTVVVQTPRASSTYAQDLTNEPKNRAGLIQPINKEFVAYKDTLDKLDTLDTIFLTEFSSYSSEVNATYNLCKNMASNTPILARSQAFIDASTTVANRQSRVINKRNEIAIEQANIQLAYTLIKKYQDLINTSYSTEQITDLFQAYGDTKDNKDYPTFESFAMRKGDYEQTKSDAKNDLNGGSTPPGGLASARAVCSQPPDTVN